MFTKQLQKKMCRLLLCIGLLISISPQAKAQQDSLIITGMVMSADSLLALNKAHFIINKHFSGTTNQLAKFTLLLLPHDTVRFSHIGYRPVDFIVPDSLSQGSYVVGVFMQRDTLELPEVVIFPRINLDSPALQSSIKQKQRERQNLNNNVALARYQAATYQPKAWDAEMNQKFLIQQFKNDYYYAGQVSPGQTLNYLAFIPLTYSLLTGRLFPEPPPLFRMNQNEEQHLKLYFEEQIRLQSAIEKTIR